MRALVIDDCKATRAMLARILHGLGLDVVEAEDGLEALALLDGLEPEDVVFVDWNMPHLNGLDFVRELRSELGRGSLRVLMVTGRNDLSDVTSALEAGVDEYLMKPFDREMIAAKLQLMGVSLASRSSP
jgi:two-component system, chemotaxis family, chemotaxis protein CheY